MSFIESARPLLVPTVEDRALDQFLGFREKVYVIIQNEHFINGLDKALQFEPNEPNQSDKFLVALAINPEKNA